MLIFGDICCKHTNISDLRWAYTIWNEIQTIALAFELYSIIKSNQLVLISTSCLNDTQQCALGISYSLSLCEHLQLKSKQFILTIITSLTNCSKHPVACKRIIQIYALHSEHNVPKSSAAVLSSRRSVAWRRLAHWNLVRHIPFPLPARLELCFDGKTMSSRNKVSQRATRQLCTLYYLRFSRIHD